MATASPGGTAGDHLSQRLRSWWAPQSDAGAAVWRRPDRGPAAHIAHPADDRLGDPEPTSRSVGVEAPAVIAHRDLHPSIGSGHPHGRLLDPGVLGDIRQRLLGRAHQGLGDRDRWVSFQFRGDKPHLKPAAHELLDQCLQRAGEARTRDLLVVGGARPGCRWSGVAPRPAAGLVLQSQFSALLLVVGASSGGLVAWSPERPAQRERRVDRWAPDQAGQQPAQFGDGERDEHAQGGHHDRPPTPSAASGRRARVAAKNARAAMARVMCRYQARYWRT
jgi:hypothetical protein